MTNYKSNLAILICLSIIFLYILSNFIKPVYAWGFNYWTEFPKYIALPLLFFCFIIVAVMMNKRFSEVTTAIFKKYLSFDIKINRLLTFLFVSLFLFLIFMIFRSRALFYGDGFTLLSELSKSEKPLYAGKLYLEISSVLMNYYSIKIFGWLFGFTPEHSFAISSSVAGVVGIWGLYKIAQLLSEDVYSKWFIFTGSLTSGCVILFFGYVENYTWMNVVGLWSLYWSVKYLKGYQKLWPALILSCLAVSFHLIALPYLALSILTYFIKKTNQPHRLILRIGFLFFLFPFIATNLLKILNLPQVLVPLLPYENFPYWSFSLNHMLDFGNMMLLITPVFCMTLLILILTGKVRDIPVSKVFYVLLMLSLFTIMETFWIDPEIGAVRDWDLLSISGFPLTILALYMIISLEKVGINMKMNAVIGMSVIALVALIPNIMEKNNVETALQRIDDVLWVDTHYQVNYDSAERAVRWGYLLENTLNKHEMARKYFERRRSTDEGTSEFLNLLNYYQKRVKKYPQNPSYRTSLAVTLSDLKMYDEALKQFRVAYGLVPNYSVAAVNMGFIFEKMKNFDSACFYLKKGIELSKNNAQSLDVYKSLFNCSINLSLLDEANWALRQIENNYPDYPELDSLHSLLNKTFKE
jgi:tetratricopeptide (TPR) repeat protein